PASSLTAIGSKGGSDDAHGAARAAALTDGTKQHVAEATPIIEQALEVLGRRHAGNVFVFQAPFLLRQIPAARRWGDVLKMRFHWDKISRDLSPRYGRWVHGKQSH